MSPFPPLSVPRQPALPEKLGFEPLQEALYVERPNRFTLICRLGKRNVSAYLPNPGRLWELLLPGTTVYLSRRRAACAPEAKHPYHVLGVRGAEGPVLLDTHLNNRVMEELMVRGTFPALPRGRIVGREIRIGSSRFDFVVSEGGKEVVVEVKSCTLFHRSIAMFPDAPSQRARRHLVELARLSRRGGRAMIVFLVHSRQCRYFLPDYHTDIDFARTLLDLRGDIEVVALALEWGEGLTLGAEPRRLAIPWRLIEREACDRGAYLLLLDLPGQERISIGSLGPLCFAPGCYAYVGSAIRGLAARLARHRRKAKKPHWHIDYLRRRARSLRILPLRASDRMECRLAGDLAREARAAVDRFGSSDCLCPSHLFYFPTDPLRDRGFVDLLLKYRMGRLEQVLASGSTTQ